MEPDPSVTLERLEDGADQTPRARILRAGQPLLETPGAVLEGALAWRDRHLLFLSDDVPYEETLRLTLVAPGGAVLDRAVLSWPYATGSFRALKVTGADSAEFRFFGEKFWTVTLYAAPVLAPSLWFFTEPGGVWRPPGLWRQMRVTARAA